MTLYQLHHHSEPMTLLTYITTVDLAACQAPFYYFGCRSTLQLYRPLRPCDHLAACHTTCRKHYFQTALIRAAVLLKGSKRGWEVNLKNLN